jgi:hypothetical protein
VADSTSKGIQEGTKLIDSGPATFFPSMFLAFAAAAFLIYNFMVFRVNKNLAPGEKFRHSHPFGQLNPLVALYKSLYPKSIVNQLPLACAVTMMLLAIAFVVFRF